MAIVFVSALVLGRNWPWTSAKERPGSVDAAEEEIMVELIPAEVPAHVQIGGCDVEEAARSAAVARTAW